MRIKILATIPLFFALVAGAQGPTLEDLQSTVTNMQQTIQDLQQQIIEMKKQQQQQAAQPPPAVSPAPVPATQPMVLPHGTVVFLEPTNEVVGHASQVESRHNFNDQQEAAQRANDLTLDPAYHGFIPIPNTPAFIKFNAKPRVDFTSDNRNSGNPDRFVTAQIPVSGQSTEGGGNQFNVNARGSSLRLDVRAPDFPGDPRFYYENDFFASGSGMPYRVKQLWGQFYNVTAGWTYSVFEDPDAWPDTVDFEGPNSMIFSAPAQRFRYLLQLNKHWELNLGIEQPSSEVDNFDLPDVTSVNHAPDGGFNVRWEDEKIGHVQFATILREVGENSPTFGGQSVLGWGLMAATSLNISKDSMQAQATYGEEPTSISQTTILPLPDSTVATQPSTRRAI